MQSKLDALSEPSQQPALEHEQKIRMVAPGMGYARTWTQERRTCEKNEFQHKQNVGVRNIMRSHRDAIEPGRDQDVDVGMLRGWCANEHGRKHDVGMDVAGKGCS